MFHIPVPPSGNCADAITNNTFIAVDTNGVVVPDQQNPDGTWKTIPNKPVLTNTDPQAPPPVTVSASPVGAHYFQDGVRTTLQGAVENSDGSIGCLVRSANNTFAYGNLTFGCVEIIPFQNTDLSWQLWVAGNDGDGLIGCLANAPTADLTLDPDCVGDVNFISDTTSAIATLPTGVFGPASTPPSGDSRFKLKSITSNHCLTKQGKFAGL